MRLISSEEILVWSDAADGFAGAGHILDIFLCVFPSLLEDPGNGAFLAFGLEFGFLKKIRREIKRKFLFCSHRLNSEKRVKIAR